MTIPLSNTGFPIKLNFSHFAGDTFERYLKLENPDGSAFDASGYSFDLLLKQGGRTIYTFPNVLPVTADGVCYVPFVRAAGSLVRQWNYQMLIQAKKDGKVHTWLEGMFLLDMQADAEAYSADTLEFSSPLLDLVVKILLDPPVPGQEPEPSASSFDATFDSTFA